MVKVPVELGTRRYEIAVEAGGLDRLGTNVSSHTSGRFAFVVTDDYLAPLYLDQCRASLEKAGFAVDHAVLPPGESTKCLEQASVLYDRLVERHADRRSVIVALGGGVIGDLAGFVAATYARGVPFFQVPTTLLAMVDSSVGGKVAVDHPRAKNMIGAFHQPIGVFCDPGLLTSLPDRQYRCGLAEVVKYGVIMDEDFFARLESWVDPINAKDMAVLEKIIAHCCRLKAEVVEQDEFETTGRRAILNYGHTFAHAFETAMDYDQLQHGEAVAVGMICAARLAERLGMIGGDLNRRQRELWGRLALPTTLPRPLDPGQLIDTMRRDKKAKAGALVFVLPTRVGSVQVVDGVDEALVQDVLAEMIASVTS